MEHHTLERRDATCTTPRSDQSVALPSQMQGTISSDHSINNAEVPLYPNAQGDSASQRTRWLSTSMHRATLHLNAQGDSLYQRTGRLSVSMHRATLCINAQGDSLSQCTGRLCISTHRSTPIYQRTGRLLSIHAQGDSSLSMNRATPSM